MMSWKKPRKYFGTMKKPLGYWRRIQNTWSALAALGGDEWGNHGLSDRLDEIDREIADIREEIERIDNELHDRVVTDDLDEAVDAAKTEAIEAVVTALNRL
jgi:uncharacterized small protein (DUF1192 family)